MGAWFLIKRERGWRGGRREGGRGGTGGAAQFVRGNYKSFKGINLTVLGKKIKFTGLLLGT